MTSNIIKSFSDKAYSYDSQSFVQKDVNKRLLSRLDLIMHTKKDILEIGSGTGNLSDELQKKYLKSKCRLHYCSGGKSSIQRRVI